jgi:hypothetical protein
MLKILIGAIFSLSLAASSAMGQQDYCFQNDSLKPGYMASFTAAGSELKGFFNVGDRSGQTSGTNFDITGTKKGNTLTIEFKDGKAPYELLPGSSKIVWTILSSRRMTIPMYRKNSRTGKFAPYTAVFGPCRDI